MDKIEIPQGFADFAMLVMAKAIELRASGITREIAARPLAVWGNSAIDCAAFALLASVEDAPYIEGKSKSRRIAPEMLGLPEGEGSEIMLPGPGKGRGNDAN